MTQTTRLLFEWKINKISEPKRRFQLPQSERERGEAERDTHTHLNRLTALSRRSQLAPISCRIPCSSGHQTWTAISGHLSVPLPLWWPHLHRHCLSLGAQLPPYIRVIITSAAPTVGPGAGAGVGAGVGVIALSLHFKSMMSRCEANEKEEKQAN